MEPKPRAMKSNMNEDVINCSCHIINKRFEIHASRQQVQTKTHARINVAHFQFEIVENGTHPFQLHKLHSLYANERERETVENFTEKSE